MDLILVRKEKNGNGIFGELRDHHENVLAVTLEHAYASKEGYLSKIPLGSYLCQRGKHRLEGMNRQFETFEVTRVPQHTGVLFHWGNYNKDSNGCILVGTEKVKLIDGSQMIINSRFAFTKLMGLQGSVHCFNLRILEDLLPPATIQSV